LKKVGVVSRFIKKIQGFPAILAFLGFLRIVCVYEKAWIGSMDHETMAGSRSLVDS
jgi:hypothetical protein